MKYLHTTVFWILCILCTTGTANASLDDIKGPLISSVDITTGYRGVGETNSAARALEYESLESGAFLNLDITNERASHYLEAGVNFLNENDYRAEIKLNTKNSTSFSLRTDRLYHNLDHIPYANGFTGGESGPPLSRVMTEQGIAGSRMDGTYLNVDNDMITRTYYSDYNPDETYGIQLDTTEAKFNIKIPHYPAHLNLSYWRYAKQGHKQMRFVGENCTTACHMQSKSRPVNKVTDEIKGGIDAHVGIFDLAVEALMRTFRDRENIPMDTFGTHFMGRDTSANPMEHSEDPDSSLSEVTFKINTAPSGGFVGSASFTVGERENESNLTSITPVKATTDYYKTSADVTYTPSQFWTLNLRYRLLDLESDNSDQLVTYGNTNPNSLDVRESMDITRAWYEIVLNYRPSSHWTLKGELRREDIDRSNTGPGLKHRSSSTNAIEINPEWQLPAQETITKAKIGFYSRLLKKSALKFSGWLSWTGNDDPAYGISYGKDRQLFLSARYTPDTRWGVMANLNILDQENNDHVLHNYELDREKQQQNATIGTYLNLEQNISLDMNYGYFRSDITQGVLFGSDLSFVPALGRPVDYRITDKTADYLQTIQTLTLGINWLIQENLSCRLEGQHSSSRATFSPEFEEGTYPYNIFGDLYYGAVNDSGLQEITELKIRKSSLRGRLNWDINEDWSCAVSASYDSYDDRKNDLFDGDVQTAMISFTHSW